MLEIRNIYASILLNINDIVSGLKGCSILSMVFCIYSVSVEVIMVLINSNRSHNRLGILGCIKILVWCPWLNGSIINNISSHHCRRFRTNWLRKNRLYTYSIFIFFFNLIELTSNKKCAKWLLSLWLLRSLIAFTKIYKRISDYNHLRTT